MGDRKGRREVGRGIKTNGEKGRKEGRKEGNEGGRESWKRGKERREKVKTSRKEGGKVKEQKWRAGKSKIVKCIYFAGDTYTYNPQNKPHNRLYKQKAT